MKPTETLTFIDNKPENGLVYDFKKIKAEYDKLGCPGEYRDPTECPLSTAKLFVDISDRSTGKTTNWILLGMCMYKLYGTNTIYIRQRDEMVAPKHTQNLFAVILEYDYISTLFDGLWNSITYKSRRWYLCLEDAAHKHEIGVIYLFNVSHLVSAAEIPASGFVCD